MRALLQARQLAAATAPPLLLLCCTDVPWASYVRECPAELKALGLMSLSFHKWPRAPALQRAAVAHACNHPTDARGLRPMLPPLAPDDVYLPVVVASFAFRPKVQSDSLDIDSLCAALSRLLGRPPDACTSAAIDG